ncbi:unnamed protein product [Paramecium octaurelia]|uniref:Transmembrane protein n=1 Tax=Paramecium octaurelia TaxID=43137 RepID=A0A8S1TVZ2_PAROT|nr:unnamed protein product [Paramecium octaurelia]
MHASRNSLKLQEKECRNLVLIPQLFYIIIFFLIHYFLKLKIKVQYINARYCPIFSFTQSMKAYFLKKPKLSYFAPLMNQSIAKYIISSYLLLSRYNQFIFLNKAILISLNDVAFR